MVERMYTSGSGREGLEDDDSQRGIGESQAPVDVFNPTAARRRRRRMLGFVASATAGAVLVGGIAMGLRGGGDTGAKTPPVATAPADQGDQPIAGASEAAPSPSSIETAQGGELTLDTFPFVTPEGTCEGIEAFKQKNQLLVGDYQMTGDEPDKREISALIDDFTAQRNAWMNSGMSQAASGQFDNYSTLYHDSAFDSDEIAKGPTAVIYTYDKAYGESFVDNKALSEKIATNHDAVLKWQLTEPSYVAKVSVSGERSSEPTYIEDRQQGVTFMNVKTTYTDNVTKKSTVALETLVFSKVIEPDGRLVWKVTDFQSEPLAATQG